MMTFVPTKSFNLLTFAKIQHEGSTTSKYLLISGSHNDLGYLAGALNAEDLHDFIHKRLGPQLKDKKGESCNCRFVLSAWMLELLDELSGISVLRRNTRASLCNSNGGYLFIYLLLFLGISR